MSLHDEFGYDVDVSLKKVKGKVARPSEIKLMKKGKGTKGIKLKVKKASKTKNKPSSVGSQYKRVLVVGGGKP